LSGLDVRWLTRSKGTLVLEGGTMDRCEVSRAPIQPKRPVNPIISLLRIFTSSAANPPAQTTTPPPCTSPGLTTTDDYDRHIECALSSRAPTFLPRSTRAEDAKRFVTSPRSPPPARPLPACQLRLAWDSPSDGLYVGSRRETATFGLDRQILTRQPAL
jgi:hypothetical protein